MTMKQARRRFKKARKDKHVSADGVSFRTWARRCNLSGTVGKLRRIVVGR